MVAFLQVFYSVFSGILLSTAIPNEFYLFGLPFISFIALIPFYYSIKLSKNYRYAFMAGFLQTATTHFCSSFWLANFKDFAILTLGASTIGTGFIGGMLGLIFYLPYASAKSKNYLNNYSLSQKFCDSVLFRIIYFAAVYTVYEWVKSNGFLGYPWGTIAGTVYKWPVIMQIAAITGIYGIGFIFSFANALLAEGIIILTSQNLKFEHNQKKDLCTAFKLFTVLFLLVIFYGVYECSAKRIPQKYISTIIVQQNCEPWSAGTSSDTSSISTSQELTQKVYDEMKVENRKPDLVVWSEGIIERPLPGSLNHYKKFPSEKPLVSFIAELETPLLTGGTWSRRNPETKEKYFYNSAIVFDENGNLRGHYGKNHLVPFAEAIPGINNDFIRNIMEQIVHISAGWTPGDQYVYFDIPCSYNPLRTLPAVAEYDLSQSYEKQKKEEEKRPVAKISTPVCFDDCFPDIMRPLFLNGSEVFMNITNDSWSLKKSSEYQHFVNASYSAIEYRTTLVRATNGGYSVVLDPTGKILADLPLFESTSLSYNVPVYERQMTTYARFGNWLPYLLLFFLAIYFVYMYKTFTPTDYIPNERKIKNKKSKKSKKQHK